MATKNTNKTTPTTIKPKKNPGWIRACFGLGSNRVVADGPVIDTSPAGCGRRRRLGSGILRAVKRPWCKKKDKTTLSSLKIKAAKAAEESTASKVGGSHESLAVVLDGESLQAKGSIEGLVQEEFGTTENTSSTSLNQSESTKGSKPGPHKAEVIKEAIPEDHTMIKEKPSLTRISAKQSRPETAKGSSKDPLMGMLILVVILVIMLLCGRICAILCTSVWFYCMPQLAKTTKSNKRSAEGNINSTVRSETERKRVVLMGFLERQQNIFC